MDVIRGDQRPSPLIVLVSKVSGFGLTKRRRALLLYLAAAHSFQYRFFSIFLPRLPCGPIYCSSLCLVYLPHLVYHAQPCLLQSHLHAYTTSISYYGKSLTESPSYYSRLCSRCFSSTTPSSASAINSVALDPWAFLSTTDMDRDFEAHV